MTAETLSTAREPDSRVSDGINVTLLWSASEQQAFVTVADDKTGDAFTLPVHEPARALDIFRHPYAYAAAT